MPDEYETFWTGTCDNCNRDGVLVRRVEATGMFKEPRGFYNICIDCFKPRVKWSNKRGTFYSPTNKYRVGDKIQILEESTP